MNEITFVKHSPGHQTVSLNGKKIGWVLNPKEKWWASSLCEGLGTRVIVERQRTRTIALSALLSAAGLSEEEIEECLI